MEEIPVKKGLNLLKLESAGIEAAGDEKRFYRGKVRDILDLGSMLFIYTTDRISAFDNVLTTIPLKGEILNQLSLFWFKQTGDIIDNHIIKEVTPRSVLVKKCSIIPVEVVVRGYLAGSALREYQKGNLLSGIRLKQGMRKNERFPEPILTPTTKAGQGIHDEPISRDEIIKQEIVPVKTWEAIEKTALALFKRGTEIAARQGLILVDTKYEFGLSAGKLLVADEIHTQDSSRYWYKDTYEELFLKNEEQRKLDKEFFRKWLMDRGYMGEGPAPEITETVKMGIIDRYRKAFHLITGTEFVPSGLGEDEEIKKIAETLKSL
ncbi:MAG: phosphoribosylaminoimidazolesuccinocarboxamide synthase [Spirochaetales bacterium]|nr:phosphoribosylaminoimidazolesuccinocarboxamide synthase [Spirochaetales bacterium]